MRSLKRRPTPEEIGAMAAGNRKRWREEGAKAERDRLLPLLRAAVQIIAGQVLSHTRRDEVLTALRAELERK